MGNNNNNKKTQHSASKMQQNANKTQQNTKELETKRRGKTEIFLIAFASVALVAIIVSIFAGVSMSSNKSRRVDFLNDNLSKYVSISKSAYDGITVEITGVDKVTERDIENAIIQLLCKNKSREPLYNGDPVKDKVLTAGDVVYLYYRGYTLADRKNPLVAFAGQMTGVEGYVESTASGFLAAVAMAAKVQGRELPEFPKTTAIGALGLYISDESVANFQPMNINFSIISPLEQRIRKKAEKNLAIANRSLEVIDRLVESGL